MRHVVVAFVLAVIAGVGAYQLAADRFDPDETFTRRVHEVNCPRNSERMCCDAPIDKTWTRGYGPLEIVCGASAALAFALAMPLSVVVSRRRKRRRLELQRMAPARVVR